MLTHYWRSIRSFSKNARLYLMASSLQGLGLGLLFLFFNLYVLSLGYDQAFVGMLAGVTALVTAIVALPIGVFLPRLGYRRGLVLGSCLLVIALLGWTLLPHPPVLILASTLFGAGSSLLMISSSPLMVAASTAKGRMHLFGIQFGLNTVAGVAANLIGGHLPRLFSFAAGRSVAGASAYRAALFVALAMILLSFAPISRLRQMGSRTQRLPGLHEIVGKRSIFGRLLIVHLILSLGAGMLMPFVNVFYRLHHALPDPSLGTLFAISSLVTGFSGFLAPLVADRLGKVRSIVTTQGLSIPFLLLMGFAPAFGISAAGFIIRTALMNMSTPVLMAYVMSLVPERLRPLTASLMTLAWNLGWAVAAWISGWLQMAVGFTPPFAITGTLYVTVIVTFYLLFRHTPTTGETEVATALPLSEDERA